MPVIVGIAGALLAAIAYGVATIAQAIGVRRLSTVPPGAAIRQRLRAGQPYAWGLALDAVGFLASIEALRTLPLFLVEAAVAGSVAVTALFAVLLLHARLRHTETAAIAVTMAGLVFLAVSARDSTAGALAADVRWLLLAGTPLLGAVLFGATRLRGAVAASVTLAATGGFGFGLVGIAARTVVIPHRWWRLPEDPSFWSIVGYGVISLTAYGYALHRGRVTTVAAITVAVETVFPALVGLIWLGDSVRPHLGALALLGFLATVGGSMALAAHADPQPHRDDAEHDGQDVPGVRHAG